MRKLLVEDYEDRVYVRCSGVIDRTRRHVGGILQRE